MPQKPRLWRGPYGVALLMVAIGTLGIWALMALIALPLFVLYMLSIAKATAIGGPGAGFMAATLALFVSNYLFLPPYFSMASDVSLLPLVVCYLGTAVLSAMQASRSRSSSRHE